MGSDDFIKLDSPDHSKNQTEENGCHESLSEETSSSLLKEKFANVCTETNDFSNDNNLEAQFTEEAGSQHVQDIEEAEDDFIPKRPILQEHAHLVESLSTLERVNVFESKHSTNDISKHTFSNTTMSKLGVEESPIAGVKRARTTYNDQQPSVRVVYNCLARESKKKLMELMQQWSQWQAKHQSSSDVSGKLSLESGEDTYFSALYVGLERTNTVSFWLDNQVRKDDIWDCTKLDSDMVPLYDRGCTVGLTSLDGSNNPESGLQTLEASRCFNCGSYSHALKECPKPRDNVSISNARKQHSSKRNQSSSSRSQTRYYHKSSGKFDDLKAGVLGPETRECLGIGERDPPPWLHRMRELGYPPGYLDDVEEDQPSGITIFADAEAETECEEGELPEMADPAPSKKRMTVEFPGINAPIPENADDWLWSPTPSLYFNNSNSNSSRLSDSHRGPYHDRVEPTDRRDDGPPGSVRGRYQGRFESKDRRDDGPPSSVLGRYQDRTESTDRRDDGPPGSVRGRYQDRFESKDRRDDGPPSSVLGRYQDRTESTDRRDDGPPGSVRGRYQDRFESKDRRDDGPPSSVLGRYQDRTESTDRRDDGPPGSVHGLAAFSRPGYSPRFSSSLDHISTPRSPHLVRSFSDRSWQSPVLYGSSPPIQSPHSSHPYSSMPLHSPQHHSSAARIDPWTRESLYSLSSDSRDRDRHRDDHYRHHHRR